MSGVEIIGISVAILALTVSIATPIIVSTSYLIKHIKKSDCCGSHVEVFTSEHELKETKNKS
jgi:hypothetical protein